MVHCHFHLYLAFQSLYYSDTSTSIRVCWHVESKADLTKDLTLSQSFVFHVYWFRIPSSENSVASCVHHLAQYLSQLLGCNYQVPLLDIGHLGWYSYCYHLAHNVWDRRHLHVLLHQELNPLWNQGLSMHTSSSKLMLLLILCYSK